MFRGPMEIACWDFILDLEYMQKMDTLFPQKCEYLGQKGTLFPLQNRGHANYSK